MRLVTPLFFLLAAQMVFLEMVEAQDVNEIAPYNVIKEAEGYEERAYPSSLWACHNSILEDPSKSEYSFWPLFGYISEGNSENVMIPMTAPVTVEMTEDIEAGVWISKMCFYLPKAYHQTQPNPLSEDVYLENRPPMNIFSRRTGGKLSPEQWKTLANELKTILESAEPMADLSTHYMASYDSPSRTTNRRNEVWFKRM